MTFPYTNNKQVEFEIKNTMPFTLVPPKSQMLRYKLTKYAQDLLKENSKILVNDIEEKL